MYGILVVNKPKEFTSNDVVCKVKGILKEKVGHTGTLDPNATGVLILLIGQGTKMAKYLSNHDKSYIATLKLGIKTDTGDITGNVITKENVSQKINDDMIINVLYSFLGKSVQKPPIYSAIKINGKKLYEYARKNKEVEIPSREIEIYNIGFENYNIAEKEITFSVSCSKGTYIRSTCESIAEKLNTVGCLKELKRTRVGEFTLEQAVTMDEIKENLLSQDWIEKHLISLEKLLDIPKIILDNNSLAKFLNGVKIHKNLENGIYKVYSSEQFVGTGEVKYNMLKRDVIIEK